MPIDAVQAANPDPRVERGAEACLLASLLRLSRLTLLRGDAGTGKSTLLRHDLLPRLRRRGPDRARAAATVGRVVVPFPERRRPDGQGRPANHGEIAVLFDGWDTDPLAALRRSIDTALGVPIEPDLALVDSLLAAGRRHRVQFLLVLDHFEQWLDAPADDAGATAFGAALVALLNHPQPPANVFIVLRGDSHPGLDVLRAQVPGFGDRWLRIRHWRSAPEPVAPALRLVLPPGEPAPPPPVSVPVPVVTAPADTPPSPEPLPPRHVGVAAGIVMLTAGLCLLLWPPLTAPPAAPEPPPAPLVAGPPFLVSAGSGEEPTPPLLEALAQALVPTGHAPAGLVPSASASAPLAVMHYDQLRQRARDDPGAGLQVVVPLYTEEIHVLVRADSPMRSMADLRGRRVNTGPAEDARALTAGTLYERLFGVALPAASADPRPLDDALQALLVARSVDAIVYVAAHPAPWFDRMPADARPAVRLLPLQAGTVRSAASARALKTYLPALVDGTPTLATMAFLVATPDATGTLIADSTRALCQRLPALRRDGHPKWGSVQPDLALDTGWPMAPAAAAARAGCDQPSLVSPVPLTQESTR